MPEKHTESELITPESGKIELPKGVENLDEFDRIVRLVSPELKKYLTTVIAAYALGSGDEAKGQENLPIRDPETGLLISGVIKTGSEELNGKVFSFNDLHIIDSLGIARKKSPEGDAPKIDAMDEFLTYSSLSILSERYPGKLNQVIIVDNVSKAGEKAPLCEILPSLDEKGGLNIFINGAYLAGKGPEQIRDVVRYVYGLLQYESLSEEEQEKVNENHAEIAKQEFAESVKDEKGDLILSEAKLNWIREMSPVGGEASSPPLKLNGEKISGPANFFARLFLIHEREDENRNATFENNLIDENLVSEGMRGKLYPFWLQFKERRDAYSQLGGKDRETQGFLGDKVKPIQPKPRKLRK